MYYSLLTILSFSVALRQEGICSTTPSVAEVQRVQKLFEDASDHSQVNLHGCEFGAVAGVLKRFFRELPAPIYTNELYPNFVAIQSLSSPEELLQEIANLFVNLPTANQMILHLLLRWLHKLVQYATINRLSSAHLGTLWQPNLIFDSSPGAVMSDSLHMTTDGQMVGLIVTMMIDYYPHFFAEFDAHFAAADAERAAVLQQEAEALAQQQQYQQQQQQAPQSSGYQNYFDSPQQQPQDPNVFGGQQQTAQPDYVQQQQYDHGTQMQAQQVQVQAQPRAQPPPQQNRPPGANAQRMQLGAIANEALMKRGGNSEPSAQGAPPVSPRGNPVVPIIPASGVPVAASGAVSPRPPTNAPVVQNYGQPQAAPPNAAPKLNVVIPQANVQVAAPGAPKQNLVVPQTPSSNGAPIVSPRTSMQTQPVQPQQPQQQRKPVPVVVNGYTKGVALVDWSEPLEGRLPLSKDDVIFITKKHPDGWWEGYKYGRRGFFPATYVNEVCQ